MDVHYQALEGQQLQRLQKIIAHNVVVQRQILKGVAFLEKGRLDRAQRVMAGILFDRGKSQLLEELRTRTALELRISRIEYSRIPEVLRRVREYIYLH